MESGARTRGTNVWIKRSRDDRVPDPDLKVLEVSVFVGGVFCCIPCIATMGLHRKATSLLFFTNGHFQRSIHMWSGLRLGLGSAPQPSRIKHV